MLGTAERTEPFHFNLQYITYSQDTLFWCRDALIYTTCCTKERSGELDGGMEMETGKYGGRGGWTEGGDEGERNKLKMLMCDWKILQPP